MTAQKKTAPDTTGEGTGANSFQTARKTIIFLKPHGRYSRGDVAGFEESVANRLIGLKVAIEGDKLPAKDKSTEVPA